MGKPSKIKSTTKSAGVHSRQALKLKLKLRRSAPSPSVFSLRPSTSIRTFATGVGVFCFTFLATFLIASITTSPDPSHAEEGIVAASINPTGYTVNISSLGNVDLTLNTTPGGVMAIAKDTVSVSTNALSGYRLYLSTSGSTNALHLDGDITNNTSTNSIPASTGTFAAPAALTNNSWGYALAKDSTNNFSDSYDPANPNAESLWAAVPTKGNEQLIQTVSGNANGANGTLDIYYGAKANMSLPAGSYSNQVSYSAVVEASSLTEGEATISPTSTTNLAGGDQVTITTSLKTNMDLGAVTVTIGGQACTNPTTSNATGVATITCTTPAMAAGKYDVAVTIPKFGKTYTITQGFEYIIPPFGGIITMQEMTPEICDAAAVGTSTTLTDIRDNNTYTVEKFADNNCWMTQNLRLKLTSGQAITVVNNTTGATSSWTPNSTTQTSADTAWTQNGGNVAHSYDSGREDYGVYYNWYAATAGTGTAAMSSGEEASSSICPKGWRLPSNTGDKSYYHLITETYGYTTGSQLVSNLGFVYSGYYAYLDGSVGDQGSYGYFWSSTADSSIGAYILFFGSYDVSPQYFDYKGYGFSVRCVSASTPTMADITNMQDMTPKICEATEVGYSKTLFDTRDGSDYTVEKFEDNNCWMTQNLRLTGSRTLTPADSNVSANWTLPATQTSAGATWPQPPSEAKSHQTGNTDYGVYYNWYAATAGTGTASMYSGNATSSICPKGWRLPSNSGNKSYYNLITTVYKYTTGSQLVSNLGFVYSGYYNYPNGSVSNQGSHGRFWSSTAYNGGGAYILSFGNSFVYPRDGYDTKGYGHSVRCVSQ